MCAPHSGKPRWSTSPAAMRCGCIEKTPRSTNLCSSSRPPGSWRSCASARRLLEELGQHRAIEELDSDLLQAGVVDGARRLGSGFLPGLVFVLVGQAHGAGDELHVVEHL